MAKKKTSTDSTSSITQEQEKKVLDDMMRALRNSMIGNFAIAVLGGIVTGISYSLASGGGTYVITWGFIIYGTVKGCYELFYYLNPKLYFKKVTGYSLIYKHKSGKLKLSFKYFLYGIFGLIALAILVSAILPSNSNDLQSTTSNTNATSNVTVTPSPTAQTIAQAEVQSGDILNSINAKRVASKLSSLEYSAVLQNVAKGLALFNYNNPSIKISSTVLGEYFAGQDYNPSQSAYVALTDISCITDGSIVANRLWNRTGDNYLAQNFKEIGIYIGKNDQGNCNIFVTLART